MNQDQCFDIVTRHDGGWICLRIWVSMQDAIQLELDGAVGEPICLDMLMIEMQGRSKGIFICIQQDIGSIVFEVTCVVSITTTCVGVSPLTLWRMCMAARSRYLVVRMWRG